MHDLEHDQRISLTWSQWLGYGEGGIWMQNSRVIEDAQAAAVVSPNYSRPMRTDSIDLGKFPAQDVKQVEETGRLGTLQLHPNRYVPRGRVPDGLS